MCTALGDGAASRGPRRPGLSGRQAHRRGPEAQRAQSRREVAKEAKLPLLPSASRPPNPLALLQRKTPTPTPSHTHTHRHTISSAKCSGPPFSLPRRAAPASSTGAGRPTPVGPCGAASRGALVPGEVLEVVVLGLVTERARELSPSPLGRLALGHRRIRRNPRREWALKAQDLTRSPTCASGDRAERGAPKADDKQLTETHGEYRVRRSNLWALSESRRPARDPEQ